jgi:hypothetical protein
MKNLRKYLVIMLAVMMSAMTLLAACGGGSSEPEQQEQEQPKVEETAGETGTAAAGDYDIMKGFEKKANDDGSIEYLYFNDFMLVMPGNEKWSFEPSKDSQAVTFYLFSAQQENYGGKLVTIKAYDINDNSYEQLPSYSVAGVGGNTNKRFIAIYPTDVQWNGQDAQQDADYRELSDYLHKIGEGAVNSPLATADSNAEPVE